MVWDGSPQRAQSNALVVAYLRTVEKLWAFNSTVTGWNHHREHREHGAALWSLRTVEKLWASNKE